MAFMTDTGSIEARLAERQPPAGAAIMYQRWQELLFLHWPVDAERIARDLPDGLQVDLHAGQAWLGIVPFQMVGVRPRLLPAVPGLSNFPEVNVRTYVIDSKGRPGVWFYSLDTPKHLPNWIARTWFHLNYRLAKVQVMQDATGICYAAELCTKEGRDTVQMYAWLRTGKVFQAAPGSLEFFLTERYRLFAYDRKHKRLLTGCVHHPPYPLQTVELSQYSTLLFQTNGLDEPLAAPVSSLAAAGVAVQVYRMETVTPDA